MYKKYFSKFLTANKGLLHFSCHSHHYWPDCSREAQLEYWDDSAKYVDDKWNYIFSNKIPKLQQQIGKVLGLNTYDNITFAPNTHELVYRLISALEASQPGKKLRILTTDSEFYSFDRQINRLEEVDKVSVTKVALEPFSTFEQRFIEESLNSYDMVFVSHVFFNSAKSISDLTNFVERIENDTIVIDGYHAFMALPTDLSKIENKIFYIAGSYKYSAGGEGCCFMISPKDCDLKPINTGWFAELGDLTNSDESQVKFSTGGLRFAGATMDFSCLYRQSAVFELYEKENITVQDIHTHVRRNQERLLSQIKDSDLFTYYINTQPHYGHFLAFELKDYEMCSSISAVLKEKNILTDYRKNILRFGFSLYQDDLEIDKLSEIINSICIKE